MFHEFFWKTSEPHERQGGGVVAHVEFQLFGTEDLRKRGRFEPWRNRGKLYTHDKFKFGYV
jgi:hypothetical protein